MASVQTVKGTNQTLVDAGGLNTLTKGLHDGRVKVNSDVYAVDGTESAGSTIQLCGDMPKGANVLAIIIVAETAQASMTISVGNSASAAVYLAAGGTQLQTVDIPLVLLGNGTIVGTATGDDDVLITTAAATGTAGNIRCTVFYSID